MRQIYDFIVNNRLADSLTSVVKSLKKQKDGIVERWYEEYEELIKLSESKFDHDEDHDPRNVNISVPKKKMRASHRF
jgi:CO dehydrogenase/acetyl-CoA synthase beta subunit